MSIKQCFAELLCSDYQINSFNFELNLDFMVNAWAVVVAPRLSQLYIHLSTTSTCVAVEICRLGKGTSADDSFQ